MLDIAAAGRRIDRLAHDLYGLTEKEIEPRPSTHDLIGIFRYYSAKWLAT